MKPLHTDTDNIFNTSKKARKKQNMWLRIIGLISILILLLYDFLVPNLFYCFILLAISSVIFIKVIRLVPRRNDDFFDPGILFITFVLINILPITISFLIGIDVIKPGWMLRDNLVFAKVILTHIILLSSFTIIYAFFSRKQIVNFHDIRKQSSYMLHSKTWILLFLSFFLFSFAFNYLMGMHYTRSVGGSHDIITHFRAEHSFLAQQIFSRIYKLLNIVSIFAFGVIVSRSRTLRKARINLLLITLLLFLLDFIIYASRGGAFIFFSAGAFADIARWKGKLLNWRLFLLIFLGGLFVAHSANIVESHFAGGTKISNIEAWKPKLFTALEPRNIENPAVIISWVDNSEVSLQYGKNYLTAIKSVVPSQIRGERIETLPEWFLRKLDPDLIKTGSGLTFSAIGEGYLNGKIVGVFIHGALIALLALAIRYCKLSRRMKTYGPFFYSATILLMYKIYRIDTLGVIKRIEWTIILTILLIIIAKVLLDIPRKKA